MNHQIVDARKALATLIVCVESVLAPIGAIIEAAIQAQQANAELEKKITELEKEKGELKKQKTKDKSPNKKAKKEK